MQKMLIWKNVIIFNTTHNESIVIARPDRLTGAEISAICQEVTFTFCVIFFITMKAGMQAVRKNRYVILNSDIEKGYKANVKKNETEHDFYR